MKNLSFLLMLLPLSLAATPERKVEGLLKDLGQVLDGSQLLCDENFSKQSLLERACEDLHQAACLDEKGVSRYEGQMDKYAKEIENKLKTKRDEVSQLLYGKNFNDAAKKALKDSGLELAGDLDDYEFSRFLREPDKFYDMSNILKSSQTCEMKFIDENFESYPLDKKISVIKRMNQDAVKLSLDNKKNTPYFLEEILNVKSSECRFEKDDPDCKKMGVIKREALMLSRQKEDPSYVTKFNAFYDQYFKVGEVSVESNEESVRRAYDQVLAMGSKQCGQAETVFSATARSSAKKFVSSVQFSKPFIEFTLAEFYTSKRHDEVTKLFNFAKETMVENLKGHVKDQEKFKKIEESYSGLKLHWLSTPKNENFKKEGKVEVLEIDSKLTLADNTIYHAFSDPSLSYFTDFNANYMSGQSLGEVRADSRVDMQPAMLTLMDANPVAFLEVLGHEVAHKVGPDVSRWNGFDLGVEHQELMNCFAGAKSIGMTPHQADEALCDYFSALIIARYLETLPAEQRLETVIQSVESYCLFENNYMPTTSDAHPDAYMRISGILGANPQIRKLMGCVGESTKFRSCGPK